MKMTFHDCFIVLPVCFFVLIIGHWVIFKITTQGTRCSPMIQTAFSDETVFINNPPHYHSSFGCNKEGY